jgi:hypothetical protein
MDWTHNRSTDTMVIWKLGLEKIQSCQNGTPYTTCIQKLMSRKNAFRESFCYIVIPLELLCLVKWPWAIVWGSPVCHKRWCQCRGVWRIQDEDVQWVDVRCDHLQKQHQIISSNPSVQLANVELVGVAHSGCSEAAVAAAVEAAGEAAVGLNLSQISRCIEAAVSEDTHAS